MLKCVKLKGTITQHNTQHKSLKSRKITNLRGSPNPIKIKIGDPYMTLYTQLCTVVHTLYLHNFKKKTPDTAYKLLKHNVYYMYTVFSF